MNLQLSLFAPKYEKVEPTIKAPPKPLSSPFLALYEQVLKETGTKRLVFDEASWDWARSSAVMVDVEVYSNFVVVCAYRPADGKKIAFEQSYRSQIDREKLRELLNSNTIITFNGNSYDLLIISLLLEGADLARIKEVSDAIVLRDAKASDLGIRVIRCNHIDLQEPNPSVRQGLKMIYLRLHWRFCVDLPYDPGKALSPYEMNVVTLYCFNDAEATAELYKALREPLELRAMLGKRYKHDFRSKSDSQIGEIIVRKSVERLLGRPVRKPEAVDQMFNYDVPDFLRFKSPRLSRLLEDLRSATFSLNMVGKPSAPECLKNLQIELGKMKYSVGIGGLHSTESHRALVSDENNFIVDVDVASQYPSIIMKLGLYPPALGPAFLQIYGELIKDRLEAKAIGDKVRADGGRIALNGVYGKLGSPYSVLYAPRLVIAVTLTGQLAVLMLIEQAEAAGLPVVSANTDGIVFYCPKSRQGDLSQLLERWETATGFKTERTPYKAIYNSSVNTYIAIKEDGKVKRKGVVANPWADDDKRGMMSKNPAMTICSDAIVAYLTTGTPIEQTIRSCTDPRAFITVVKVATGGTWRGFYLGRAVRYYWSMDGDPIMYKDGVRKVSKTDGSRPLLELTDALPDDIDYTRYCEETVKLAEDLGVRDIK